MDLMPSLLHHHHHELKTSSYGSSHVFLSNPVVFKSLYNTEAISFVFHVSEEACSWLHFSFRNIFLGIDCIIIRAQPILSFFQSQLKASCLRSILLELAYYFCYLQNSPLHCFQPFYHVFCQGCTSHVRKLGHST